jgi:TRAP-type C4-dicarboxylate transport system permease large subunit
MLGLSLEAVKDVAERAVRTFVQTFLALYAPVVLGAGSLGGLLDLSVADKAAAAGVAAVLTVVMGVLGVKAGSSEDNASVR